MTASQTRGAEQRVDGRSERRRRGRQAVVDAAIALIEEHQRPPAADEVAERAGVSAATLFRYFPTLDDLRMEAIARFAERTDHLAEVAELGVGDFETRITSLIDARLQMYNAVAPIARFARARATEQPLLADVVQTRRDAMALQVAEHFAVEVDGLDAVERADVVHTVTVATSFEAWDLATSAGRSREEIVRAWRSALRALLT